MKIQRIRGISNKVYIATLFFGVVSGFYIWSPVLEKLAQDNQLKESGSEPTQPVIPLLISWRHMNEKRQLFKQIQEYKEEMSKISQVDEFAKYSKVQRKMRALSDQLTSIRREDTTQIVKYNIIFQVTIYVLAATSIISVGYQLITS
ncbi:Tail-anchored protein insertion receptor WRB [Fragariocoptes setiger]|uniref:Guided entry of tail-anchored proteins factor 1 n=1 Tax=Fragariocoptes setiger TaxID=1670756 RepID=A0ABQ7SAQ0_9ACAR|nr:Tail-anchored protein insertion receptor WRB [Fragariocoptes setiger]